MSFSFHKYSSICLRGGAVCLVWMLSLTLWQSAAEATCGDYLMSHSENHHSTVTLQQSLHPITEKQLPVIPLGCPHGDCRSQDEAPAPVGSTADSRIVDETRSCGWLNARKLQGHDTSLGRLRPVDELLPASPFKAVLERPPQNTSV